eukprot:8769813-Karenia_brevis.AAC.1
MWGKGGSDKGAKAGGGKGKGCGGGTGARKPRVVQSETFPGWVKTVQDMPIEDCADIYWHTDPQVWTPSRCSELSDLTKACVNYCTYGFSYNRNILNKNRDLNKVAFIYEASTVLKYRSFGMSPQEQQKWCYEVSIPKI